MKKLLFDNCYFPHTLIPPRGVGGLLLLIFVCFFLTMPASAQVTKKLYDEKIDPLVQIDEALQKAKSSGKYVICQVGGNWCPWCLRFADFITADDSIARVVENNFVYIHVNYSRRGSEQSVNTPAMLKRLGNPGRFGYPVMVVLDSEGRVLHTQDSSFLEEDKGYNRDKVLRFFNGWTPRAVKGEEIR